MARAGRWARRDAAPQTKDAAEGADVVRGIVIAGVLALWAWASVAGLAYVFAQVVLAVTD